MILASTLAYLAERRAVVYRVDFPEDEYTSPVSGRLVVIEERSEHFATHEQALRAAHRSALGEAEITPVAAEDVPFGVR